jgi:hypothetical protein
MKGCCGPGRRNAGAPLARRALALWLAASAPLSLAACELLAGLEGDNRLASGGAGGAGAGGQGGTATGGGGAGATGAGGQGGGGASCVPATYPPPPPATATGGALEIVAAVRTIDMGETTPVGLDLDGRCTCHPDPGSCLVAGSPPCDTEQGGIDSASARIFEQLSFYTSGGIGTGSFTDGAESGSWSLVLRVLDYNGMPDDADVRFRIYTSQGTAVDPLWDGSDAFGIDETSLVDGATSVDQARYLDDNAYVSGGVLVASLPQSAIKFVGSDATIPVNLVAGFLVAKIVETPFGFGFEEGVLAARWPVSDVFDALSKYRDDELTPLCTDNFIYGSVHDIFCENRDIFSGVATPTTECDSISMGIGFTADPVVLGPIQPPAGESPGCPFETDPANDEC